MKRWRVIENEWNKREPPWRGAVGIEEIDDEVAVPGIVGWFMRGWPNSETLAQHIVDLHNASLPPEA